MFEQLLTLAAIMAKFGLLAIGGSSVVLAGMEHELVGRGWITHSQFIEAYALGQLTPGLGSAYVVAIGYHVAGYAGAVVSLLAHLGPPALLTVIAARVWFKVRKSPWCVTVRTGLVPLAIGLTLGSGLVLGQSMVQDLPSVGILLAALGLFLRTSWSTPGVLGITAAAGALLLHP